MSQSLLRSPLLMFMIGVSFFGVILVVTFALNPPMLQESFLWRKQVIGLIFGSICVLGIIAIFFPEQCSAMLHTGKVEKYTLSRENSLATQRRPPTISGHHPDCEGFSAHVLHISNKTLCAACTGLLIGGLIALIGTTLYFFGDWRIGHKGLIAVLMGLIGISFGLFQFKFRSFIRSVSNLFFVLGAFLVLVGIDVLTQSVFVDLYVIVLIVFWLFTRILLSQWVHRRICYTCEAPCEISKIGDQYLRRSP